MKIKEGRLLAGIGFGSAVIAGLIISQIGERPMGWATHLQTFPDPAPAGDTPFVPSPTGDCDEGFSAVIEYLHGRDPSSGDPLDQPTILLRGDWNLVEPFEYSFATRIPRGTLSVDEAGLKAYPVTITRTVDGITSTCVVTFGITGISVGDEFVLDVPCVMEPNTPVSVTVKLKDGSMVEVPDDILSPAGSIVPDNGSELHIRRTSDGSSFSDHKFRQGGQEKTGVPVDNQGDPFEFIDEGLYELELIWFEPPPPNGTGPLVEISRAKARVVVGDPESVAKELGMTVNELFSELGDDGKTPCEAEAAISICPAAGSLGKVICIKGGKFKPFLSKDRILKKAMKCLKTEDTAKAENLAAEYEGCVFLHEVNHAEWFREWSRKTGKNMCEGVRCGESPEFPGEDDEERTKNCIESEDAAYDESIGCLEKKLKDQEDFKFLSPEEEKCLRENLSEINDVRKAHAYINCYGMESGAG